MMDAAVHLFILCVVTFLLAPQTSRGNIYEGDRRVSRDWGPWTGWSVCSETCGHGTAYRIRHCHAHHNRQKTGTTCQGAAKQYKLCIMKNCTNGQLDYRSRECAKHNNVYYGQNKYSWIPYINSQEPCELSCKSAGFGYYARFNKMVADFVTCNDENTAVCIHGQCVKAGCDGIFNSGSQVDKCGVCGGDGTSCLIISGIFTRTHLTHKGYNVIATIPAGACSINITELWRSNNHLALSTPSGYLLNGNMRLQGEGTLKGAGTTFTYARGTGPGCPGECLTAPGPLSSSVRVELIYFGRNPGISYHFTIPREAAAPNTANSMTSSSSQDKSSRSDSWHLSSLDVEERMSQQNDADLIKSKLDVARRIRYGKPALYMEHTDEYESMPQQLQSSIQDSVFKQSPVRPPVNSARDNGKTAHKSRSPEKAEYGGKPAKRNNLRDGDNDDLKTKHSISSWPYEPNYLKSKVAYEQNMNQFYVKGENGSIEYKHYYHTNVHDDIGDIPIAAPLAADSKETDAVYKNKGPAWLPGSSIYDNSNAEFQSTYQQQLPTKSSSLANVRLRSLQSQQESDSVYSQINSVSQQTDYYEYDNRLSGGEGNNHLYSWRISGFTPCSEPCGGGLQETRVICIKGDSKVEVMQENCVQSLKPESTTMVCNTQPCEAKWEMGEWDTCSVTCGRGLQKRAVECKQKISHKVTISVPSTSCPQPQPLVRQYCQYDPCFIWKVSHWSKCSSECGFGQRTRSVSCVNSIEATVNASWCSQIKPLSEEICDMGSCAHGWFHSKWSAQCSSECGWGHYTRQVYCLASDGSQLEEKKCSGKTKPKEHKLCRRKEPCGGQWFTGTWSQCNATCGSEAYRHRDVMCIKHHGKMFNQVVKEHNCIKEHKPPNKEVCGSLPLCKPDWFAMPWSECSQTCGTGVKTREVKCLDAKFSSSPDCKKDDKPSRRQPCNTQPCKEKYVPSTEAPTTETNEAVQMDESAPAEYNSDCKDVQSFRWCHLAKQARLCYYSHYRKICCHTCRKLDPKLH